MKKEKPTIKELEQLLECDDKVVSLNSDGTVTVDSSNSITVTIKNLEFKIECLQLEIKNKDEIIEKFVQWLEISPLNKNK